MKSGRYKLFIVDSVVAQRIHNGDLPIGILFFHQSGFVARVELAVREFYLLNKVYPHPFVGEPPIKPTSTVDVGQVLSGRVSCECLPEIILDVVDSF